MKNILFTVLAAAVVAVWFGRDRGSKWIDRSKARNWSPA